MQKLKLFFKLFYVLVAVLFLALAAFVITFDPNNYNDRITAEVEKQTGRDFEIAF